jgi:uncharacterized protein YjiS (DUF1127 family)
MHFTQCCNAKRALHFWANAEYISANGQSRPTNFKRTTNMNFVRTYNNWRRYRETVAELGKLSTRELNDLGIHRADIPFVARRATA